VYTLKKGLGETITYDVAGVVERYGLKPDQLIDFKALRGDPSDNVPGVKGIGEKTALDLLKHYGSLDAIYQHLRAGTLSKASPKVVELLRSSADEAKLSKKLVTIVRDVPLEFSLEDCRLKGFATDKLVELFHRLEFKSLLPKIPELQAKLSLEPAPGTTSAPQNPLGTYHLVQEPAELEELLQSLAKVRELAVDTETTSVNPWEGKLVGVSLSRKGGQGYFVAATPAMLKSKAWKNLLSLLASTEVSKVAHNAKYDLEVLTQAGGGLGGLTFDTLVAAYLLRSGERGFDLKSLVFQEFGVQMTTIESLIGSNSKEQKTMAEVPLAEVAEYASADADFTMRLKEKLAPQLKALGLLKLFDEVEMPLVPVLAQVEAAGVKIDVAYLKTLDKELTDLLGKLEKKIHKLAGTDFNVNSPKQLKEVLFDKLKLSPEGLRHTKSGVSTAASELEKMRGLHPIIEELFTFRELSKLLSTYVKALPELVNKNTGRVHTSYNQTVAATGRLSSSDPNLQNIPIRGEWGSRMRRSFIAEPGYKLVSADYSQIELRVAAHLASDQKMVDVFKRGHDIHTSTAAFIFDVAPEQVTPDQRRSAKEVNFGVLYGMGAWGLSERTGLSRTEAHDFIDRYFKAYPKVAEWIEQTKAMVRKQGYVTTLLGRRRNLPEVNSGVAQVRAAAERMAVNLPVQGTAADLMKMAMVNVAAKLPEASSRARMIMQVHDELVFEVPEGEATKVGRLVKREMEQALKLSVPIVVEVKVGDNWNEMTPLNLT
jgi:DNA polymerase-1